jgi:membrane dipeptidase
MEMNRRNLVAGAAGMIAFSRTPVALAKATKPKDWFSKAIVIDGLSSFSDPYAPDEQMRLSEQLKNEIRQTGTTAINITIGGVGNDPDVWDQGIDFIKNFDAAIAANPDFLVKIQKAADIGMAKAQSKFGLIYGTQDSSMVGTALDRLGELKSKGVRIVQLTYNLRNLSGDGALEGDNAGLSKLGHATIKRIEAEKLLLDLSHGGAKTIEQAIAAATRPLSIIFTTARCAASPQREALSASISCRFSQQAASRPKMTLSATSTTLAIYVARTMCRSAPTVTSCLFPSTRKHGSVRERRMNIGQPTASPRQAKVRIY